MNSTTTTSNGVLSAIGNTPLVPLTRLFPRQDCQFYGKLEASNPGGSIKDRTAKCILEDALRKGQIERGATIIESSSGNMAIGLAQACRYYDLNLIVVVDPNVNQQNVRILEAYGACISYVTEPHPTEGLLGARLQRVQELLDQVPNSYWSNQYANPNNPAAHYQTMGEIVAAIDGSLDYLFVATSTCGTIMGCAQYIDDHALDTQLVAVDAIGSVIFGTPAAPRIIPGHGAGRPSQLLDATMIDDVVHVSDWACVQGSRRLLDREAILAGGSSGAVVSAVCKRMPTFPSGASIAMIFCDRGERYLDTIYSDDWVERNFAHRTQRTKSTAMTIITPPNKPLIDPSPKPDIIPPQKPLIDPPPVKPEINPPPTKPIDPPPIEPVEPPPTEPLEPPLPEPEQPPLPEPQNADRQPCGHVEIPNLRVKVFKRDDLSLENRLGVKRPLGR